jgi:hypothetical protein
MKMMRCMRALPEPSRGQKSETRFDDPWRVPSSGDGDAWSMGTREKLENWAQRCEPTYGLPGQTRTRA